MFWFTSDEHYGHAAIVGYCNRQFSSVEEMDKALISNFNDVVMPADITVHAGDFCWCNSKAEAYKKYVSRLNGDHIFLIGSHDRFLPNTTRQIWSKMIDDQFVVVCHYCMRTWERSHYNSWQLYGHSHGRLNVEAKQYDIGVDNNGYFPISFDCIKALMGLKPDNPNYLNKEMK